MGRRRRGNQRDLEFSMVIDINNLKRWWKVIHKVKVGIGRCIISQLGPICLLWTGNNLIRGNRGSVTTQANPWHLGRDVRIWCNWSLLGFNACAFRP
jgi:hypothetical protein